MEEEQDGEELLLATPARLLPSPAGSRVSPAGGALEMEEKQHFEGLRAESAPAGMGHHAHLPMT